MVWTFKAYLAARKINDTVQGDFTRDALADPAFPDTGRWRDVLSHLRSKHADRGVIDAGRLVFAQYRRGARLRFARRIA